MDFVSPQDLQDRIDSGKQLNILDIRTKLEHDALRLQQLHEHIPLDQIYVSTFEKQIDRNIPLYLLCKMGPRAIQLGNALATHNIHNTYIVEGGIMGCQESGMALEIGTETPDPEDIQHAAQVSFLRFLENNSV